MLKTVQNVIVLRIPKGRLSNQQNGLELQSGHTTKSWKDLP